jgi:ABC-type spermidine/putrescine transport system permease subunit II
MSVKFPVYPRQQVRLATRIGNWLLGGNAALVFGFLYLPVLILIVFSFNDTRSVAVFSGFSTEWYTGLSQNAELLEAAKNSLLVGLITTIVATTIGTLTALAMDRYRFKLRTTFDANLYLPIVIPEIVMGISLLLFFNQALFPFLQNAFGIRATTGSAYHHHLAHCLRHSLRLCDRPRPPGGLRPHPRGGRSRPRRGRMADLQTRDPAAADARHHRRRPVGFHPVAR